MSLAAAPAARRFDGTPAAPDLLTNRGGHRPGRGPGVGRGTNRDQREAVSLVAGLVPKHHPKVLPTPTGPRPRRRRKRLTTRPAREPRLTGLSPEEMSPPLFEWPRCRGRTSIGTGRGSSPAQPPGPAGPGRRSPHECWVRLARGRRGQESRPLPIAKPGLRGHVLATAAVTPEKRRQEGRRPPWPWKLFSLDSESLMNSRAAARPDRPVNGGWSFPAPPTILTAAVEAWSFLPWCFVPVYEPGPRGCA